MHLLFNMYWTFILGRMIETRRGTLKIGLMVLVIAVASNIGQFLAVSPSFGGMSGVVFGLFGYVWMKTRFEPELGMFLSQLTIMIMIAFFFICMTGIVGNIANWAHGVGLVVGVLLGYAPIYWRNMQRRPRG